MEKGGGGGGGEEVGHSWSCFCEVYAADLFKSLLIIAIFITDYRPNLSPLLHS